MKRLITSMIAVIFLFSFSLEAFANSGPVFWQGYPSSDVMSIDEHSPIAVENETLVFDFSDGDNSHYAMSGKVKATYEMRNATNEMQSVQMAFPFVGRLDSLKAEDIVITTDGSVLPYEVYLGDVVNSYGNPLQEDNNTRFDFDRIVSTLTDKAYSVESIGGKKTGKLYLIEVIPLNNQRINCAIDFTFDEEKTKVITNGFNRYERSGQKTKIAAWCYEPKLLEVFVLGEDINLEVNGFLDGSLEDKTDLFTYRISTQEIELKPYLMERINKYITSVQDSEILDIQLFNLYAKALEESFVQNEGCTSVDYLLENSNYMRIITLLYTVEFPPNSTKEVGVSFATTGTMDKTKTAEPLHSFEYILNPARNWSDFKNLNIKIITPQKSPFIVKSSVDLTPGENNVYTANLAALPEGDLSFTLYIHEKITFLNRVEGKLSSYFGYFSPLVIGVIALLIIGSSIIRAGRKR